MAMAVSASAVSSQSIMERNAHRSLHLHVKQVEHKCSPDSVFSSRDYQNSTTKGKLLVQTGLTTTLALTRSKFGFIRSGKAGAY